MLFNETKEEHTV